MIFVIIILVTESEFCYKTQCHKWPKKIEFIWFCLIKLVRSVCVPAFCLYTPMLGVADPPCLSADPDPGQTVLLRKDGF
jgi:hypothetical protein